MPKPTDCELGIFFDSVHIITVNYGREEVRLFENGGSGKGHLFFKHDEAIAKVPLTDPYALMNLAFHFVMGYDLLSQIADKNAMAFFEQIGAKEFLDRLAAATSEEDRRNRLNGLGPKFTTFAKDSKTSERRGRPPARPTTEGEQVAATQ